MKICVASLFGEGAFFSHVFDREGQDSCVSVKEPRYASALEGIVKHDDSVSPEQCDMVLFDTTGMGAEADDLREQVPTIGDSVLADRLEEDRVFSLDLMARSGVKVSLW